jgi:mannan endo-1,4-beta-mannosidase
MKLSLKIFWLIISLFLVIVLPLYSAGNDIKPVTPNASPEAKALLKFFYSLSGTYTLTGQHNYPNVKDRNSQFAATYIGKTPVVWSTDMGFARDGDTDSYLARPDIVEEAKRQHRLGSIITLCWHAVPPTADEPVVFRQPPGATSPDKLASVQGQLLDQQFKDVLTPGTELYKHWCAQVDSIAFYLKKLRDAHVPILWRPYHEMNGDWFWWGGRRGEYSTARLYRQLFDRLVKYHKLTNLIWVWSMDRPNKPEMEFSNYFPGKEYLDILALDVYGSDFNQTNYDNLVALSNGKPLVLGEVGNPPVLEILAKQPKWSYYVVWAGMVRNTSRKQYQALVNDPRILSREDPVYQERVDPFRAVCGLPLLPLKETTPVASQTPDFSGNWIFNEDKSTLDNMGAGMLPYKMAISQKGNDLSIQRSFIVEWGDDRVTDEKLTLDGREATSEFMNSPRVMTAKWSDKGDALLIDSKVTFNRGGQTFEMKSNEIWTLTGQGTVLSIAQTSNSFRGERKITMIYEKQ